jgi:hypothetical protein
MNNLIMHHHVTVDTAHQRRSEGGVCAAARPVSPAAASARRRPRVAGREERRGLRADGALRQRQWVPEAVVAVAVRHVPRAERLHRRPLRGRHRVRHPSARRCVAGCGAADGAAAEREVRELGDVGRVLVVHLVAAPRGGPAGAVPDGGVQRHGLGRELRAHGLCPHHLPDRCLVDVESAGCKQAVQQAKKVSDDSYLRPHHSTLSSKHLE